MALSQIFLWEFHQIFKNIFFIEHLQATASDNQKGCIKKILKNISLTPCLPV